MLEEEEQSGAEPGEEERWSSSPAYNLQDLKQGSGASSMLDVKEISLRFLPGH